MKEESYMDIIRQRIYIEHDDKNQRKITIEYTIRSKKNDMENIILHYKDYLPSLIIRDERNYVLPLMSSNDVKILFSNYIKKTDGETKDRLQKELDDINNDKKHLLWISLKGRGMKLDEIRTITLTYLPKYKNIKKPFIKIRVNKQKYPLYYSLFSPVNFDFIKPKYIHLVGDEIVTKMESPKHVFPYISYHSLSLRIKPNLNDLFFLMYSLKPEKSAKVIILLGSFVLSIIPILYFITFLIETYDFQKIHDKQIEIALFIIGASLILPKLQSDQKIRNKLILYYLLPIILGLVMLFG